MKNYGWQVKRTNKMNNSTSERINNSFKPDDARTERTEAKPADTRKEKSKGKRDRSRKEKTKTEAKTVGTKENADDHRKDKTEKKSVLTKKVKSKGKRDKSRIEKTREKTVYRTEMTQEKVDDEPDDAAKKEEGKLSVASTQRSRVKS
ncbi:hypothetical protein TELCIR_25850, partial [Teladorsagia circumcincta]